MSAAPDIKRIMPCKLKSGTSTWMYWYEGGGGFPPVDETKIFKLFSHRSVRYLHEIFLFSATTEKNEIFTSSVEKKVIHAFSYCPPVFACGN